MLPLDRGVGIKQMVSFDFAPFCVPSLTTTPSPQQSDVFFHMKIHWAKK